MITAYFLALAAAFSWAIASLISVDIARSLGGIADMKKIPDLIFIIDTNIETLAINEASKLKIPIVAIIDTNSNPMVLIFQYQEMMMQEGQSAYIVKLSKQLFLMQKKI